MEIIHNYSASSLSSPSPILTAYSSEDLADVASRVIAELNLSISDIEDPFRDDLCQNDAVENVDDDDQSEFEFAVVLRDDNQIFDNGLSGPMFPIFNTDLIYGNDAVSRDLDRKTNERESSETDDLAGIPSESYCTWTPKKKQDVMIGKKSNSTGSISTNQFRMRDLLYNRSSSDGKKTFMSLNDKKATKKKVLEGKKKAYVPNYRQGLVWFFGNVHGTTPTRTVRLF